MRLSREDSGFSAVVLTVTAGIGVLAGHFITAYINARGTSSAPQPHHRKQRHSSPPPPPLLGLQEEAAANSSYSSRTRGPLASAARQTYHTSRGSIVTHYQDATTRVNTDEFFARCAQRQPRPANTAVDGAAPGLSLTSADDEAYLATQRGHITSACNMEAKPITAAAAVQPSATVTPSRAALVSPASTLSELIRVESFRLPSAMPRTMDGTRSSSALAEPPTFLSTTAGASSGVSAPSPLQSVALPLPRNPIYRIVVTGGPCSGKSTGMHYLKQELEKMKFAVYCVPEVATMLMLGGARLWLTPEEQQEEQQAAEANEHMRRIVERYQQTLRSIEESGGGRGSVEPPSAPAAGAAGEPAAPFMSMTKVAIQRVVLQLMMMLEDCFYELASIRGKPSVLLFDRGTMDGSAYCTAEEWAEILRLTGYTNEELRDTRYDAVLHFVTAALGAEQSYTLANNATRRETIAEAVRVDAATRNAWRGHFLVYIVDNSTAFEAKLTRAASFIRKVVGFSPCTSPATSPQSSATTGVLEEHMGGSTDFGRTRPPLDVLDLTFTMTGTRAMSYGCHWSPASSRDVSVSARAARSPPAVGGDGNSSHEVHTTSPAVSRTTCVVPPLMRHQPSREVSAMQDINASTIGSTLNAMPAAREDYDAFAVSAADGEASQASAVGRGPDDGDEPDARRPHAEGGQRDRRQTLPPPTNASADAAAARDSVASAEGTSLSPAPQASPSPSSSVGRLTAADDGLQRHFMVRSVDLSQVPPDAVTADITMIFLKPTRPEYLSEVLIRRAKEGPAGTAAPVMYFRRVEFIEHLFTSSAEPHGGARNVSTRPISRGEFHALAQYFDPTQPLLRKTTRRFLYGLKHLTLVTFIKPDELCGVSRVVGPAELTLEDLPPWIIVDEEYSMTATNTLM